MSRQRNAVPPFDPPGPEVGETNYCDREGAKALKALIEAYWRSRGQDVTLWLDDNGFHVALRTARVDVRSDMINGLPRPPGTTRPAPRPRDDDDDEEADLD